MQINGEALNIDNVWAVAHENVKVELAADARKKMISSREYIMKKLKNNEVIYGVNTGFGSLSSIRISDEKLIELQKNLIRSHCCGVGENFSKEESRAIMLLRANALSRGHSGIRPEVVDKILEFLNNDVIPVIPQQGSVGASGDLAPLSHLALAIIGEGEVWGSGSEDGKVVCVTAVLESKNIKAFELQAKEGLSMINGCQVMTAVGLLSLHRARNLSWITDLAGAMTLEAMQGSRKAFDPLISASRPHPGEAKTAKNILKLLGETSTIAEAHANCSRVQDAYSLRCMPQVHGATKDTIRRAIEVLEIEANSSTDNPLVFDKEDKILSCGNFHGEPVAFQMDFAAIAMAAQANISECRIEKLINPAMSGLAAFLAPDSGLNSGHMIVQVAAASLVSENKILTHPASVDSIPTSADKEDHVSMGTIAARKFGKVVDNAEYVVAMELLSAAQALDLLRPLEPSSAVRSVFSLIREKVPFAKVDRIFSKDIKVIREMIVRGDIVKRIFSTVGTLDL